MAEVELSLIVTGVTGAGRQEVVHDEQLRAGHEATVE